jgi:hypothetical protein
MIPGTFVFTAEICTSVVAILHPGWEPQIYQVFLINVACALLGLVLNVWLFNCEFHLEIATLIT